MRRKERTFEYRKKLREKFDTKLKLEQRKNDLLNKQFRKSPFFISVWIVRGLFILFFILVSITHNIPKSISEETILYKSINRYTTYSGGRYSSKTKTVADLTLKTNKGIYKANIASLSLPPFGTDDKVCIETNYYGRPIYFYKPDWLTKVSLQINFGYYFITLFLTSISLAFNNIKDKTTIGFLLSATILDLLTVTIYFIN